MKTIKYAFKNEWYNILLLLLPFLAIPFLWSYLPEQMPTHINFAGEINDYSAKSFGLLFIPLLTVGIYFLLLYLPNIDPKKRIEIDQKPMPVLRTAVILLLLIIHLDMIVLGLEIGLELHPANWIYLALAIFFVVMGNYMKTIQPNYFIGIRLPWTLENAKNWRKTHRLGSYVWVIGGALLIVLFPFLTNKVYSTFFFIILITITLIPAFYSFYLYKTKF
ncbi:MAG TPA: SdpI family protein [Balneolaceae bacterium]|nr:SdpI family protein [Balneolaceae bacterium]